MLKLEPCPAPAKRTDAAQVLPTAAAPSKACRARKGTPPQIRWTSHSCGHLPVRPTRWPIRHAHHLGPTAQLVGTPRTTRPRLPQPLCTVAGCHAQYKHTRSRYTGLWTSYQPAQPYRAPVKQHRLSFSNKVSIQIAAQEVNTSTPELRRCYLSVQDAACRGSKPTKHKPSACRTRLKPQKTSTVLDKANRLRPQKASTTAAHTESLPASSVLS